MSDEKSSRRAMQAPPTNITPLTTTLLERVIDGSRASARLRMILPLHKSADANLHRMFNAMQPGTYIPPHRHVSPPKAESILVVRGALCFFTFDESGTVEQIFDVAAGSDLFGVDIEPGVFHTFLIIQPDTVMYEVKPGPYSPIDDKDFAAWAPREGHSDVAAYVARLEQLRMNFSKLKLSEGST